LSRVNNLPRLILFLFNSGPCFPLNTIQLRSTGIRFRNIRELPETPNRLANRRASSNPTQSHRVELTIRTSLAPGAVPSAWARSSVEDCHIRNPTFLERLKTMRVGWIRSQYCAFASAGATEAPKFLLRLIRSRRGFKDVHEVSHFIDTLTAASSSGLPSLYLASGGKVSRRPHGQSSLPSFLQLEARKWGLHQAPLWINRVKKVNSEEETPLASPPCAETGQTRENKKY
jgi:hypothetical protein